MYRSCCLSLLLFVSACGKKDENKASPSATPPSGSAADPAGAPPPPAAGGIRYTCEQLIPQAIRDKYFKDDKVTKGPDLGPNDSNCDVKDAQGTTVATVTANCNPGTVASKDVAISKIKEILKDAKDVTDIGKGGLVVDIGEMKQYTIFDDNADCQLIVQGKKEGVDFAVLAKEIVAAFPPAK